MKKAKSVTIRINGKGVAFELDMSDEDVIVNMISSLSPFLRKGFPIRIIQTSTQALSKSQSFFSRLLTRTEELAALADDIKRLLRVQQERI